MDYSSYGLRGDQDEIFRRAVRDGFRASGLSHAQFTQALEWYRDHVRPGMDETALFASFSEFANNNGWDASHLVAAQSVHSAIQERGPQAVMAPTPTPEEDKATIERANKAMREGGEYWKDLELQEAMAEALERQQATPPPQPDRAAVADQIERGIAQRQCDKFAAMLRDPAEAAKYWSSPALQQQFREALAAAQAPEVSIAPPAQPAAPEVAPPIAPEPSPAPAEAPRPAS